MKRSSGLLLLLVLIWTGPAAANLRGPAVIELSPSSALYSPKDGDLVVLREDLTFTCGTNKSCEVVAEYHVRAASAVTVQLAFITPGEATVRAQVGDADAKVQIVQARPVPEDTLSGFGFGVRREGLHEARFEGLLAEGDSVVRVEYTQALGAVEMGYGYFSDGEFVDEWGYETWPLREWKLDKDFAIHVTVSTPRQAPGWWARNFGSFTHMVCNAWGSAAEFKPVQQGGRLTLTATLTEVPDRLNCRRGRDNLVGD